MTRTYQIADRKDSRTLAEFLSRDGQLLLPILELIEQAEMAVDELIDVAGRATIEGVPVRVEVVGTIRKLGTED